ncbi:MAG: hypothetical protein AAF449_08905, partial [Myxococcota bacterium]
MDRRAAGRKYVRGFGCWLAAGIIFIIPAAISAQTWRGGLRTGASIERLPAELSLTRFVDDAALPQTNIEAAFRVRLTGEMTGRPTDRLGLTFGIDTGLLEISGRGIRLDRRSAIDQLRDTLLLGRAFAELQLGPKRVVAHRAGRYRPPVGAGTGFYAD